IAVSPNNGVGRAQLKRLVRIERRVNAAKDHPRSTGTRDTPYLIAPQRVERVNPYTNHIPRMDCFRHDLLKGFVDDPRIAEAQWSCGSENKKPARRDHRSAKRTLAGINKMNRHKFLRRKSTFAFTGNAEMRRRPCLRGE